jgi:nucleoside 2-deoxyribosyltransferase
MSTVDVMRNVFGFCSRATAPRAQGKPQIYLAGPFTQHLVPLQGIPESTLSGGLIAPESAWRRTLLATTSSLEQLGWSVFLPHRDVSAWGERHISPGSVARECLEAVLASDAVLAVMGESFGTHVEVGAALASCIPVVVVRAPSSVESYFASAVADSPWAQELELPTLDELPRSVEDGTFERAMKQAKSVRMASQPARLSFSV